MTQSPVCSGPEHVKRAAFSGSLLASVATGALLVSFARDSCAEQFVLLDATFDYTWADAMNATPDKSHFYVNEGNFLNKNRPKNWLSPVDYRNGTLHVRTEVFVKPPGTQSTGWTLCYIANVGGYGCADTVYYTSTGIFENEVKMTSFWNNDQLQWDNGVKQVDMIYAIDSSGMGHITNYPQRVTMVQVSAGSKYDPSILARLGDAGSAANTGDAAGPDAVAPLDGGSGSPDGTTTSTDAGAPPTSSSGVSTGATSGTGSAPMANAGEAGGGAVTPPSSSGGAIGATSGAVASSGPISAPASHSASGNCALSTLSREDAWGAFAACSILSLLGWARRSRRTRG